jgi:competence protein ComEC
MCQRSTLVLLVVAGLIAAPSYADRVVPSVRVTTQVTVREQSDGQSQPIGSLRVGESLPFLRNVPRYREVLLPNGRHGFVSKSFTTVVHDLAPRKPDELRIHFLNVGAGTCTLVECPGATDPPPMIVDCGALAGTAADMKKADARTYVQGILASHGAAPNLVISHADRDHYGWISEVLRGTQVQNIWLGGDPNGYTADNFPTWIAGEKANGASVHANEAAGFHNSGSPMGTALSCGDAATFILTVNTGLSTNSKSLILAIDYEDFSVTFTGDAEGVTEQSARANSDEAVQTTVLSGSHHGARTHGSNSPEWAEATSPDVVVFSAGRKFGHPQCEAVSRYRASLAQAPPHPTQCGRGSTYDPVEDSARAEYMTELNGRIIITSNGHPPLSLFCTGSAGCDAEIPF